MKKTAKKQSGISLLELMVSLTIGLVMLLSLASVYVTASQANRIRSTDEDMDEAARQVFDRLQQDLDLAGYVDIFDVKTAGGALVASEVAKPTLPSVQAMYGRLMPTPAPSATTPAAVPQTPIEVASNGTYKGLEGTDNSLTVVYQAAALDPGASIPVKADSVGASSGMIADCIGQESTLIDDKWIVNNYDYEAATSEFRCKGQPIVDGVDAMTLRYLVTAPTTDAKADMYDSPSGLYVTNLMSAAQVNASALKWAGVTGVEVCMVIAGEPIDGQLAAIAGLQQTLPRCERDSGTGAFLANKARPAGDNRLYRRYVKVLTIPNALYYSE